MPYKKTEDRKKQAKRYYLKNRKEIREKSRIYRLAHPEELKEKEHKRYWEDRNGRRTKQLENKIKKLLEIKSKLFLSLGGKCLECGNKDIRVIEFHHKNPKEKELHLKKDGWVMKKYQTYLNSKDKLEPLCANCHRIKMWKH